MSLSLEDEILKLTLVSDPHYLIQPLQDEREATDNDESDNDESDDNQSSNDEEYGTGDDVNEQDLEDAENVQTRPLTQTLRQMFTGMYTQHQAAAADEQAAGLTQASREAEMLAQQQAEVERQARKLAEAKRRAKAKAEADAKAKADAATKAAADAKATADAAAKAAAEEAPAANTSDEDEVKRPDPTMLNTYKTDKFTDVDFVKELREQNEESLPFIQAEVKDTKNDITNDLNAGIYKTKTSQRWILVIHEGRKLLRGPFLVGELRAGTKESLQTYDITDKSTAPNSAPSNQTSSVRRSRRTRKQRQPHNVGS